MSGSSSPDVSSVPTGGLSADSSSRSGRRTRRAVPALGRHARRAPRSELHRRGRCLTDDDGTYRFVTVLPGAYPWKNHPNAWRPKHIHFSLFGRAFTERLVTQMYFPGDPLFPFDPIFHSIRDERARQRLVSTFELELTANGRSASASTSCSAAASDAARGAAR